MIVWLVDPYCTVPGEGWRDSRYTLIARTLAAEGHSVVWWTAQFSHQFKNMRSSGWTDLPQERGFIVRVVPTNAYSKHVGLARVWFEVIFSWRLYWRALSAEAPDVIIAREPSQISSYAAVLLARKKDAKLVVDIFDLWPELFVLALPRALRFAAPVIFWPFRELRRHNLRAADAVISVCRSYLDLAYREVPKLRTIPAEVVFIGIELDRIRSEMASVPAHPQQARGDDVAVAIYAGTLGENYDIATILAAAELLQKEKQKLRILIAGDGPYRQTVLDVIKQKKLMNVEYLGVLSQRELLAYYKSSDIGLCPYIMGSTVAMPTKIYDYLAAGLAIIHSLPGEISQYVEEKKIGLYYVPGRPRLLADAMISIVSSSDFRRKCKCNSYNSAAEFDLKVQYPKVLSVLADLRHEGPRVGSKAT